MWKLIELSVFVWGPTEQDFQILLLFYAKRETLTEHSVWSKPEGKFGTVLMDLMSVWTLLSVWVCMCWIFHPFSPWIFQSLLCLISAQQQQLTGAAPGSLISPTRHHLQCSLHYLSPLKYFQFNWQIKYQLCLADNEILVSFPRKLPWKKPDWAQEFALPVSHIFQGVSTVW